MGTYNILKTKIECPRCQKVADQEVDLHFAYTNEMLEFNLRDKYLWHFGRDSKNGGRPENGNVDGEGYVVCELCRCDFFVSVKVRNDVIEAVEHDSTKKPFLATLEETVFSNFVRRMKLPADYRNAEIMMLHE